MQTDYRTGQWYVIVTDGALVALSPEVPADAVVAMWERMPQHPTVATVLDALTSRTGGTLSALPPFAAVLAEGDDVRVALRGDLTARVRSAEGDQELTGADVTTWSERFVTGASRIEVVLEASDAAVSLPVRSGVVRAAAIEVVFGPATLRTAETAIAPAADDRDASGPSVETVAPSVDTMAPSAETVAPPLESSTPSAEIVAPPVEGSTPSAETVAPPVESSTPPAEPGDPAEEDMTDAAAEAPGELTLAPPADEPEQSWDATVHVVPAPVTAPPAPVTQAPASPGPSPFAGEGDHDGETISAAQLRALRGQGSADDADTAAVPAPPVPPMPPAPPTMPTGRIRVSTGQVVALDRTVVIGRRPRSTRASGASLPYLIAVDSPEQDISRSHLEIRPEGDTVVVIDLHTTNGSTLLRPGADPVRLHPGEQTLVLSGDVVDLGDGVTVSFEDLP